jgi:hypothetical protein
VQVRHGEPPALALVEGIDVRDTGRSAEVIFAKMTVGNMSVAVCSCYLSCHDQEALRRLKKRLSSRARAPVSLRTRLLSVVQRPCSRQRANQWPRASERPSVADGFNAKMIGLRR